MERGASFASEEQNNQKFLLKCYLFCKLDSSNPQKAINYSHYFETFSVTAGSVNNVPVQHSATVCHTRVERHMMNNDFD